MVYLVRQERPANHAEARLTLFVSRPITVGAGVGDLDLYVGGPGVERVLYELLHHRCRARDELAGVHLLGHPCIQYVNPVPTAIIGSICIYRLPVFTSLYGSSRCAV